jgi:hypothetical protein
MTTPVQPAEGSDDVSRDAGSEAGSEAASEAVPTDERKPGPKETGVRIGLGEASSFEPEEDRQSGSE